MKHNRFEDTEYYRQTKSMRKLETLDDFPKIKGFDFENPPSIRKLLDSFATMGIQATELSKGIKIARKMIKEKAKIFLTFTSNMVSSGNREVIKFLVKHEFVHAIVTSAGGVEEDLIKCLRPFVLGSFDTPGRMLLDSGIGRIGNIFAPYDRYLHFERFVRPVYERIYKKQKETGKPCTPSELIWEFGKEINNEESIMYWAYKNKIPVFCPAITDGSIGDLMYFEKQKKKDFYIDVVADHYKIVKFCLENEKTGAIILGGSTPKHYTLNANIFKEGLNYAVYITTANEFDASDSGGNPQEAVSWAKINPAASAIKIRLEASIAFPLLVAGSFARIYHKKKNL
jgi:deoxyhypusine synthase